MFRMLSIIILNIIIKGHKTIYKGFIKTNFKRIFKRHKYHFFDNSRLFGFDNEYKKLGLNS